MSDFESDVRNLKRLARVMQHMTETANEVLPEDVAFLGWVLFDMAHRIEAGFDARSG